MREKIKAESYDELSTGDFPGCEYWIFNLIWIVLLGVNWKSHRAISIHKGLLRPCVREIRLLYLVALL